jgi:hypothetical protein
MDDMGKWKLFSLPGTELQRTDERGGGATPNVITAVIEVRRPVVGGSSQKFRRNALPNCRLSVACFAYSTTKSEAVPDYTIPHATRTIICSTYVYRT